jgi:hypothetical protein
MTQHMVLVGDNAVSSLCGLFTTVTLSLSLFSKKKKRKENISLSVEILVPREMVENDTVFGN